MTTKQSSSQPQPQPPEQLVHPNNSKDEELPSVSLSPQQSKQSPMSSKSKDDEIPSTSLKPSEQPIHHDKAKDKQVQLLTLRSQPSEQQVKSNDPKNREVTPISLKPHRQPPEQQIQKDNTKDKQVPLISLKPQSSEQPVKSNDLKGKELSPISPKPHARQPEQPIPQNDSKVEEMSLISPKLHPQPPEQPIQQNDSENKDKKTLLISQKPHKQPPPEKPIQQNISKDKDKKVSIVTPSEPQQYQYHPSTTATISTDKTILNKYQLGRFLGSGRFAKVYYARSLETNKSVAIKVIDKLKTETSVYPRIVGEIIAMSKLDHPNILHIHEVMASKQKIYLVMELAKGGDLSTKLTKRPDHRFPEPLARRYFQQLVSALCYCHVNGVAHRDVKPQNILLDEEGNIKVSDFGLSAIVEGPMDSAHLLETACGTPAFAAPEIVGRTGHSSKYDGSKADAWSCGVMLFVMLTGHLPFDDGNLILMYRKMIKKEFRFSSWVPKPARGLITRLLDPNPETRMSVDEIMKDPWFKNHGMLYPRSISLGDLASLAEKKPERKSTRMERTISMNAFEIISTSPALDLSGLFEVGGFKSKTRSSSRGSLKGMVETVVEEE